MQQQDLVTKKCLPCEGGVDPFDKEKIAAYLPATPEWTTVVDKAIEREFIFRNFKEAIAFINQVADLAEAEGHHPDIYLHDYKQVRIRLWTHAIDGLSENDFILAVKIDILDK